MVHRIREGFIGGIGMPFPSLVEADETAMGGKRNKNMPKAKRKELTGCRSVAKPIVAGVKDRPAKQVSASVVEWTDAEMLQKFVTNRTADAATVHADEANIYIGIDREHESVWHSVGEYVRGDASTNGMEVFWSLFEQGYHGTFHHLPDKHLDRYAQEFAGRNNPGHGYHRSDDVSRPCDCQQAATLLRLDCNGLGSAAQS